ncbi:MAG: glycosyltransferase [Mariprofundaceae bacterium]|nr:glycosyltransferase [Mariprofundaceae bacterium]
MTATDRILLVTDVSAEVVHGGAERMLIHHIRALLQAGKKVTVLTRQPEPDAPVKITLENGVVEYRLPYAGDRGPVGLKQLKRGAAVWWQEHSDRFDAVVAEQPFTIWALLQAGCGLPRLQVCHSFAFEEYTTRHGRSGGLRHRLVAAAMRRLERKVYRSADGFLVLSRFMQERLSGFFRVNRDLIALAPGGVDIPDSCSSEQRDKLRASLQWEGPVVVTLRNLVPRTGVDLLVAAAGLLKNEMPQLRWCVIGRGALLDDLRAQAEALGVSDRVEFAGYLSEAEVRKRLCAADLFMLPTRELEGFGLVTLEANACGLPVVATPVTANKEVVPSLPCNRLADAVSADALTAAVREMLQIKFDQASRQALSRAVEAKYAWHHHDTAFVRAVEALRQ